MHGNVWEWVEDDWHGTHAGAPDDGSVWIDTPRGAHRVDRGGCWFAYSWRCRSAFRIFNGPGYRYRLLGFRLALSPGQPRAKQG